MAIRGESSQRIRQFGRAAEAGDWTIGPTRLTGVCPCLPANMARGQGGYELT